uniref:ABC-2 type transporter n=1 Tax=Madagascaria erythrocladioides TaxID=753684 RepID=UPI001BF0E642|nr:ABC-2 type transporter [Madagascaria erythrocladioides]QUE28977.1 Ycf38 [Madagascaria erythrocladioides]UNJ16528.1 ABC-2 type transporter [Madagascaria erythrocladioides]
MSFSKTNQEVLCPQLGLYLNKFTVRQMLQEIRALSKRFFIQSSRRLSFVVSGTIQPLLWLLLFGAIFQRVTIFQFQQEIRYIDFLSAGILVFTAFTSALNAGLPIMFDREFGFFNRILVSPIASRFSILAASSTYIICVTTLQIVIMLLFVFAKGSFFASTHLIPVFIGILVLLIFSVTIFSLIISFILPGHIELLALILLINLPILFSSSALAPLQAMPKWLQTIAGFNPLTYAIDALRYIYVEPNSTFFAKVFDTIFGELSLCQIYIYYLVLNILLIIASEKFFDAKLE